jgi:hypothetical protein
MIRPEFLTAPTMWTRASRTSQSPAEYACAVERHQPTMHKADKIVMRFCAVCAVALVVILAVWG